MIKRTNNAGVGVRNPHGTLRQNSVRGALYYARKNRLSRFQLTNTTRPTITGTAAQGETLTGHVGEWVGVGDISYTYRWKKGGVNISGATNLTYVVQAGDVGSTLTFTATAVDNNGVSVPATSAATGTVV